MKNVIDEWFLFIDDIFYLCSRGQGCRSIAQRLKGAVNKISASILVTLTTIHNAKIKLETSKDERILFIFDRFFLYSTK